MADETKEVEEQQPIKGVEQKEHQKTPCWLSCELRLDDFCIKDQSFEITGWINVFWILKDIPQNEVLLKLITCGVDDKINGHNKRSNVATYKNDDGGDIVQILDLRYKQ